MLRKQSPLVGPEKKIGGQKLILLADLGSVGVEYIRNDHNYNKKNPFSPPTFIEAAWGKFFYFLRGGGKSNFFTLL